MRSGVIILREIFNVMSAECVQRSSGFMTSAPLTELNARRKLADMK